METPGNIKILEVQGCRVRFYSEGNGEPLLFLHGYRGFEKWGPFHSRLADHFRFVSVEHPGFGQSERPPWLTTVDDLAFFYLDIMDALELDRVHLVGNSLGGWIAAEFAARYTHRVASLVLADPMGLYVESMAAPDIFMNSPEQNQALLFHSPDKFQEPEEFVEVARAQAMTARLGWNPRLHDPKLEHRLHRIDVPVLLVWGDCDRLIPPAYADEFRKYLSQASVQIIPQCGHFPQVEQPEALSEAIVEFVRSHCGPSGVAK